MTKEQFMKQYPEGMIFHILGTNYTLHYDVEQCKINDANGLAELYSKKIILSLDGYESENVFENVEEYYKKVLRHELLHAFFHEMGLSKYSNDETLIDALAIKMPQICATMSSVLWSVKNKLGGDT